MEKDDEIKGEGNSYDFGARMHDPRVGRWLSGDPAANLFPDESPYLYSGNNPIYFVDPNGKWKVKWKDNNDHTNGIVFEAEKGDNLSVLADQMGIPYQQLLDENFGGKDFTLDNPLNGGEWLRQKDLPGVEVLKNINTLLKENKSDEGYNCAAFCVFAVDGEMEGWLQPDDMTKELLENYKNVKNESDAQIGDIVTFENSFEDFWTTYEGEAEVQGLSKEDVKASYNKSIAGVPSHFSVVLLKSPDGSEVQSLIQKAGITPVEVFNCGIEDQKTTDSFRDNMVTEKPASINNEHETPIYRKEEKK